MNTPSGLSAKLKSLGVKVGARDVPPPDPAEKQKRIDRYGIELVVPGREIETPDGPAYVVEGVYDADYHHGHAPLHADAPLAALARWARDERMANCPRDEIVFLDTETTGLAGGTGTLPFMIGVGRFGPGGFRVAQFFMRDPADEPAVLAALDDWFAPCSMLVTFNGKAFDMPLVASRYTLHRRQLAIAAAPHLDLLPLARRLWRDRLASRALGSLEQHILGVARSGDEVPGWLIPMIYFEYLKTRDARPLRGVFYHNAMDIVAMAALLGHMAQMLADPLGFAKQHPVDLVALAKMYEEWGDHETAQQAYNRGMEHDLPAATFREAARRLSHLHRKRGEIERTLELWHEAAKRGELDAHISLAKHYEHRARDYARAEQYAVAALGVVNSPAVAPRERKRLQAELNHRLARIRRKAGNVA
ncbi:MAG: ribonuclease H-like domain-containing protein [Chloroflexi bacterium]|nr:ribonuclease H-like domain-containing protein [Chloroflexota bacterium]